MGGQDRHNNLAATYFGAPHRRQQKSVKRITAANRLHLPNTYEHQRDCLASMCEILVEKKSSMRNMINGRPLESVKAFFLTKNLRGFLTTALDDKPFDMSS